MKLLQPQFDLFSRENGVPEAFELDLRTKSSVIRTVQAGNAGLISRVNLIEGCWDPQDPGASYDACWLRAEQVRLETGRTATVRVVDLFAGCGGMSLGLTEACRAMELRAEHALAVESNAHALQVYADNFPHACTTLTKVESLFDGDFGDTPTANERKLARDVGEIDFLLAGPPCQGHSDLNNHTRRADPRNSLYLRLARCAEILKPRHVIIENVPGVVHDRASVVHRTTRALTSLGYIVESEVVRAADIGVPQTRRRHLLVATRATGFRLATTVAECTMLKPRTFAWACGDLADVVAESVHDSAATHAAANATRIDYLFDHDLYDLPDAQRPECHRLKRHSYGAVYGRLRWDEPVPTITRGFGSTGQGRFVHPTRRRSLTPHEAARLQFFPDRFTFDSTLRYARQIIIGNAVPSKLSYVIALGLLREDFYG